MWRNIYTFTFHHIALRLKKRKFWIRVNMKFKMAQLSTYVLYFLSLQEWALYGENMSEREKRKGGVTSDRNSDYSFIRFNTLTKKWFIWPTKNKEFNCCATRSHHKILPSNTNRWRYSFFCLNQNNFQESSIVLMHFIV